MTRRPLVLLGLFLCVCASASVWILIDGRPPEWGHANHLERAVGLLSQPAHRGLLGHARDHRGLVVLSLDGLLRGRPCSTSSFPWFPSPPQAVMMASLALAMAAIYGLGRRLDNARAGFWGALIFATAPFVVFSLTNFRLDLPLAAMVALALYTLVRSDDFTSGQWSLGLGMVFGLGMLTKPPFAVYVLPPFLWSLWARRALGRPRPTTRGSGCRSRPARSCRPAVVRAPPLRPAHADPQPLLRPILWLATLGPFAVFSLIQNKDLCGSGFWGGQRLESRRLRHGDGATRGATAAGGG
jgi:hypothetical protein